MQQEFFATRESNHASIVGPINVASVPQRSPFRYPGGKTWFVPTFRRWMKQLNKRPNVLIEPFAGGATIALAAVCEDWVDHAVLIELDPDVAAVWQTVSAGDAPLLAQKILGFDLTVENVKKQLLCESPRHLDRAFKTILKNRTFHGGILAAGSGLIKAGEAGKGISSRWYPETLAKRFNALHVIRDRLTVLCGDSLALSGVYAKDSQAVFFIDPPYTAGGKKAGKRLYTFSEIDHSALFDLCANVTGEFVMTYDDADEVHALAQARGFSSRLIAMKNTHPAEMSELIIGRNLSWLDAKPLPGSGWHEAK
jgi:DNA adenine methylase